VPVWLRILAGLLALAALFAAVSLVDTGVRGTTGLRTLLISSVRVIIDVCMAALFAYVALIGLVPTHLLRSAGDSWTGTVPRFRLEPALQRYLRQLIAQQPLITECWILLHAENGRRPERLLPQCWLLVFGPAALADVLHSDWNMRRRELRLFVADADTGAVSAAWGRPYVGTLADWQWEFVTDEVARFVPPADAGEQMAVSGDRDAQDAGPRIAERLWSRSP
jgi:hypothetical protein